MKKQYNLKELVELIKNIEWVSQSYPEGIKLGAMTSVHLVNCIDYIQRRLQQVGNVYSQKQEPFTYQQWLYLMNLQLLSKSPASKVMYEVADLHRQVNTIVFNYELDKKTKPAIVKIKHNTNVVAIVQEPQRAAAAQVTEPKPTPEQPMNNKTKKGYIGTRINGETANEIRVLARKTNKTIEELGTEGMLDLLKKYEANPTPKPNSDDLTKVYLSETLEDEKRSKVYLTVNEEGISFVNTIKKASLFSRYEAEVVMAILGRVINHRLQMEMPNYCVRKENSYLTRQEGWVCWTLTVAEADQFNTEAEAQEVINSLNVIFKDDLDKYSVIYLADATDSSLN